MTHDFIILPDNKDLKDYWAIDYSYELRDKEDIFPSILRSMTADPQTDLWNKLDIKFEYCTKRKASRDNYRSDDRIMGIKMVRSNRMYLKNYRVLDENEYNDEDVDIEENLIRFNATNIGYKYTPYLILQVAFTEDNKTYNNTKSLPLKSKIIYGTDEKQIAEWLYTEVYAQIILKCDEYRKSDHEAHQHNLSVIKALTNTTTDEDAMKAYKKIVKDNKKKERDEERARQERVDEAWREHGRDMMYNQ
jgi:hypothetical protein